MGFRIFLALLGIVAWALTLWLGTHVSADPAVLGRWSKGYFAVLAALFSVALLFTAAHVPFVYRRLHAVRGRLLAVFLSVIGALVALEVIVRVADPLGISYYAVAKEYNKDKVFDPELGYGHLAGVRKTYGGIVFDFNELGMRERPIGPKADREFRLLFLGDSVVFGAATPVEEAFVRLVEPLLAKRLDRPVRTINGGVSSYNTTQEFGLLKRHAETIDPDLVLLVYADNDHERPKPEVGPGARNPPEAVTSLLGRSWLYRLVSHVAHHAGGGEAGAPPRGSPGWRESMEQMGAIADYCRARGTPFAAVLWRYGPSPLSDALWADLSSVASAKGFLLGDMGPAFEGRDFRSFTISPVDSHVNALGHRLAAERIDALLAPLLPR